MVALGSGSKREVKDYMLTRFACYLIAQNGDPKKEEIAFIKAGLHHYKGSVTALPSRDNDTWQSSRGHLADS